MDQNQQERRVCRSCGQSLPLSAFERNGTRYRGSCKRCRAESRRPQDRAYQHSYYERVTKPKRQAAKLPPEVKRARLHERSKRGGATTKARYGREHYQEIGRKGALSLHEKYGTDHFRAATHSGT